MSYLSAFKSCHAVTAGALSSNCAYSGAGSTNPRCQRQHLCGKTVRRSALPVDICDDSLPIHRLDQHLLRSAVFQHIRKLRNDTTILIVEPVFIFGQYSRNAHPAHFLYHDHIQHSVLQVRHGRSAEPAPVCDAVAYPWR